MDQIHYGWMDAIAEDTELWVSSVSGLYEIKWKPQSLTFEVIIVVSRLVLWTIPSASDNNNIIIILGNVAQESLTR